MAELTRAIVNKPVCVSTHHYSNVGVRGRIAEQVVIDGTPQQGVRRKVMLIRLPDVLPAAVTYSDLAGNYEIRDLELGHAYVPVGLDHTGQFEAVAAGPVTPMVQED